MSSDKPYFSIVIPTYNRRDNLAVCLQAIARLDYPRDRYEVLVVDDGGNTPLEDVVSQFDTELNLKLVRQANAGPAAARNAGAFNARGEILAFTDDDCEPDAAWLDALYLCFANTPQAAIGGRTLNSLPQNIYSTATDMLIEYLYGYLNPNPRQAQFFTSNNLALPSEAFKELGGFNTSFPLAAGEDREFCDHWLHRGHTLNYAPEAIVYHSHNMTFSSFWKQHFNYGRGSFHFHQLRAKRDQKPVRMEPLKFYLDSVRYPFSRSSNHPTSMLILLLTVSQAANALGYFAERVKKFTRGFTGKQ